jgi:hypothetical protein
MLITGPKPPVDTHAVEEKCFATLYYLQVVNSVEYDEELDALRSCGLESQLKILVNAVA